MRNLLGGKGVGLHIISLICVSVPPGFIITTEVFTYYYSHEKTITKKLDGDIQNGINFIEGIVPRYLSI